MIEKVCVSSREKRQDLCIMVVYGGLSLLGLILLFVISLFSDRLLFLAAALLLVCGGFVLCMYLRRRRAVSGLRSQVEVDQQARLFTAIEQSSETVVITDADGTIQYVNPAFETITGYSRDEALGKNPRILKSGRHDKEFYTDLWQTITSGRAWKGTLINKRFDGKLYEEEAVISRVCDAKGAIIAYVAVKRDVTRERSIEEHLRQQQHLESLGTLAGGIAHEVNNPIAGIMNYAELISSRLPEDDPLQKFSRGIIEQAGRVAAIIRNLLEFTRPGKQESTSCSVQKIITETLSLVDAVLRRDGIFLEVDIPDENVQVICRSQQIKRVLMNLFTNARDALNARYPQADPRKRMYVRMHRRDERGRPWVRITVEDHGMGVPQEIREKIFDPFFTTKPPGDTGMGLAVSFVTMKEHGGRLSLDSKEGEFSMFHMDLPASPCGA